MSDFKLRHWIQWRKQLALDREALTKFACAITNTRDLLPWQASAALACGTSIEDGVYHKLALGGYGSGKTSWGLLELFIAVLANPGCRFLVATPVYDQVKGVIIRGWQKLVDAAAANGYRISKKGVHGTELIDELVCGGQVYFRSYNKVENLLGFEFAVVWLDELDTVMRPNEVFDTVNTRVRENGAQWREIIVTTTPDQGLNGTAGIWQKSRVTNPQTWFWIRSTAFDNLFLKPSPEEYVRGISTNMSQLEYDITVMAKIKSATLAVYAEYGGRHAINWQYDKDLPYDLAFDGGDSWPHYLWIQRHPSGYFVVFDEYAPDMIAKERHRLEVQRRCAALGKAPENIAMDRALTDDRTWAFSTWKSSTVAWCQSQVDMSISHGIGVLKGLLDPAMSDEPKLYVATRLCGANAGHRGIDKCLRNYRHKEHADGTIAALPFKDNIHDHGADALRYWAVLCAAPRATATQNVPYAASAATDRHRRRRH